MHFIGSFTNKGQKWPRGQSEQFSKEFALHIKSDKKSSKMSIAETSQMFIAEPSLSQVKSRNLPSGQYSGDVEFSGQYW